MKDLTPSLEDYLEAIWTISLRDKVARVKDVARHLAVTTPSVVSALNALSKKNLIKHERYGYIELTEKGILKAKDVYEHHRTLFTLLNEVFGIDSETASKEACKIEHYLSGKTIKRIKDFLGFLEKNPEEKSFIVNRFREFLKEGEEKMEEREDSKRDLTLRDLNPGEKARVTKIIGKGALKKRLLEMGIVPGTEIQLERVAPLGDPVDVLVKNYHLSLRKEEAAVILLERF